LPFHVLSVSLEPMVEKAGALTRKAHNASFRGCAGPPMGQGEIGPSFIRLEPFEETSMADIVQMKMWRDAHPQRGLLSRPQKEPSAAPGAALLFFTGVRYERPAEMSHRTMDETALRLDSH
jgi:hypothetical protein